MSPFERLGRFVHRRRWVVIGVWAAIVLLALPFAPQAPGALKAGGFSLDDLESARARGVLERELGVPPSGLAIVYRSDSVTAGSPEWTAAAAAVLAALDGAPHVVRVIPHGLMPNQVSADGHTAYDLVLLDFPPDESPDAIPILEPLVAAAAAAAPEIDVALAGGPAFYGDVQRVSEEDLRRSELISLPLAGIALVIVFGSLVAAGVPLAIGGASVLVALAAIYALASVTPMSIFVLNLATLLGLGLGVDYSLLLTSRFREELARGGGGPDRVGRAVEATVATAGRAVFFSGLTVLLGLMGLILFEFMILRSVGLAGAIVVGVAVLAAMTLLPALLSVLGPRIDALAIRRVAGDPASDGSGAWARLAHRVMDHPIAVLVPTLATPAAAGPALPPRPVQRARRDDPARVGAVARLVRPARARVRGGDVRADDARGPDDRRRHNPRECRAALRVLPPARGGPPDHRRRGPRRRRSAPDRRAVPAALRLAQRPA